MHYEKAATLLEGDAASGDLKYVGPLDAAINVATWDRVIVASRREDGRMFVTLNDLALDDENDVGGEQPHRGVAEWGVGDDFEQALRFALGALFGPVDEGYDEARLLAILDPNATTIAGSGKTLD